MKEFIEIATIVLVFACIVTAIWVICRRKTVAGSVGAAVIFLCGGFVIIPIAKFIATIACWILAIGLVLLIVGCIAG